MKYASIVTACVVGLLGVNVPAVSAVAQDKSGIAYEPPTKPEFRPIYEKLRKRQVLETLQRFLSPLKLSPPLTLKTAECGSPYAVHTPGGPVTICYEYISLIESVMPGEKGLGTLKEGLSLANLGRIGPILVTREMATVGPFVQQALHETAVTVFDRLEVPIWGRLPDAADYLAAYLMLQFGTDVARKTVLGTAYFLHQLDLLTREGAITDEAYLSGIRPTIRQRYYNILCISIGKDPIEFSTFIAVRRPETTIDLPANRIGHCRGLGLASDRSYHSDYHRVARAFAAYILPSVDQESLKTVRATKWIPDE